MPESARRSRFPRLALDYRVNVLALLAFVLSTGSLAWQGVQAWRGARITMSNGERVNFVRQVHPAVPEAPYLVVNARLDYVNTGAVGRDAIVAGERLVIGFDDLGAYEYRWFHFEMFVADEAGRASVSTSDVAHSFVVPGGGAATHQTTFVAFPDSSVETPGAKAAPVLWHRLLERVETQRPIRLRFLARDRQGRRYSAACTLRPTDAFVEALAENHWGTALCEPGEAPAGAAGGPGEAPGAAAPPAGERPPGIDDARRGAAGMP